MIKYKLMAVIATGQYENIQPSIELEAETFDIAHKEASQYIDQVRAEYGKTKNTVAGSRQLLKAFVGGEIYFDATTHTYTNEKGEVYLSGSVYAQQFAKPFDAQVIVAKMADKSGVPASEILKMWEMKRDVSNGYGTALHLAMQLYGEYMKHSGVFNKEYHIHELSVFKDATQSFYASRKDEVAEYEALVVDHRRKYAGQIDRLVKVPNTTGAKAHENVYWVEDFKSNHDLPKDKLENYWHQLSFYGSILEAGGIGVAGLRIHHWNGKEWTTYEHEMVTIKE